MKRVFGNYSDDPCWKELTTETGNTAQRAGTDSINLLSPKSFISQRGYYLLPGLVPWSAQV